MDISINNKSTSIPLTGLGTPILVVMILAMMTLPMPTPLLDILFSFNITLALIVVMVTVYTIRPLNFAAFPTVLLIATLLRLALNVASTRVVLLNGHEGPGAAGTTCGPTSAPSCTPISTGHACSRVASRRPRSLRWTSASGGRRTGRRPTATG